MKFHLKSSAVLISALMISGYGVSQAEHQKTELSGIIPGASAIQTANAQNSKAEKTPQTIIPLNEQGLNLNTNNGRVQQPELSNTANIGLQQEGSWYSLPEANVNTMSMQNPAGISGALSQQAGGIMPSMHQNMQQKSNLGSFKYTSVIDPNKGVKIMSVFLPEGWTVSTGSSWEMCSAATIAYAYVEVMSPDRNTSIIFSTPENFSWGTSSASNFGLNNVPINNQGCNFAKRFNYLPYNGAEGYLRYVLNIRGQYAVNMNYKPMPEQDRSYKNIVVPLLQKQADTTVNYINANTKTPIKLENIFAEMTGFRGNVVLNNGVTTYSEHIVSTLGTQYLTKVSPYMIVRDQNWYGEVTSYYAASENDFNRNYELFQIVALNSHWYPDWFMLSNYYGNRIRDAINRGIVIAWEQISDQIAAEQKRISELPREEKSVDSKVNEAISDTIKEQNDYTDKDGEHFKVSTKYDVYVDSDDRYYAVDPSVPVPDSFHKLEPNEIKDY